MYEELTDYSYELPQKSVKQGPAPISRRAIAYIIDLLIFNLVFYTPYITVFQITSGITDQMLSYDYLMMNQGILTSLLTAIISSLFILLVYLTLTEYVLGRTLGQQLMGLKVTGRKGINNTLIRNLTKSVLIFLLPIDLLGYLTSKQDRLSNIVTKTKVLYESRLSLVGDII